MLEEEQVKSIKEQIISQIDSWDVDENQKSLARQQIEVMSAEDLENFLIKNKMIKSGKGEKKGKGGGSDCPFCMIAKGELPSFKIGESEKELAVLEINPMSRGHSLIVPKKHGEAVSENEFVKEVSERIKRKLNAREINLEVGEVLGHKVMNIIPIYNDSKLERKKANEKELLETQKEILKADEKKVEETPEAKKVEQTKEPKLEEIPKAPRRIP